MKYYWNVPEQFVFRNESDKSIGLHGSFYNETSQSDVFDQVRFNQQYLHYTQILDTDYENYILLYTCKENGEYLKQYKPASDEEVFKSAKEVDPVWPRKVRYEFEKGVIAAHHH